MSSRHVTTTIARLAGAAFAGAALLASLACAPFGAAATCYLDDPTARVNGGARGYTFALDCNTEENISGRISVNAGYDPATRQTSERISHADGNVRSTWLCPEDPWTRVNVRCERLAVSITSPRDQSGLTVAVTNMPQHRPYSSQKLDQSEMDRLNDRLIDALQPRPTATPRPTPSPTPTPTPRPTKPDLMVTRVSGPATVNDQAGIAPVYEVVLANDGTAARGTAQVQISMAGKLEVKEMVDTPNGFTCESNEWGVACLGSLGGIDDAIQTRVAIFKAAARATGGTGDAWVIGSANHDGTLDEMTGDNNLKMIKVTVE